MPGLGPALPQMPGEPMPGKSPVLPKSPMGGPPGPGASPMASPGGGAGNEAAADAMVQAIIPTLHKALSAYPVGDKKYSAVLNSLRALTSNFGKEDQKALVPAAIKQMGMNAQAAGGRGPPGPPPGLKPAPMPGPAMPGGLGGGGGPPAPPGMEGM